MMKVQRRPAVGVELEAINRDMRESQRALELRKFFAPDPLSGHSAAQDFNDSLNNDGALDAYAETIVWRLRGVHCMVSLIDRGTQYFLAGCIRSPGSDDQVMSIGEWFGCSTVGLPGGLCENTLALDLKKERYPCFEVPDLSSDDRFAKLPVVDGTISSYRYYAGTPITTSHGVNIGSFFFFDNHPRPNGLLVQEKKFLHQQAANVMKHMEIKREATERRRVALMSQGLSRFLERDSQVPDVAILAAAATKVNSAINKVAINIENSDSPSRMETPEPHSAKSDDGFGESTLDKIRVTLDQAAEILRESLELNSGGVVFLDTAIGYTEIEDVDGYSSQNTEVGAAVQEYVNEERTEAAGRPRSKQESEKSTEKMSQRTTRQTNDKHKASKILAMSASGDTSWDPQAPFLDTDTMQTLIHRYPKGYIWYIDEEGYFKSLEQISKMDPPLPISPSGRRKSVDVTKQRAEASKLSLIFPKAKQVIWLPLWDAGGNRWYSGLFVWSENSVPVFTVESEIAYLQAFTNSMMVEISRLDSISSNKMKSDFISSISHEFRSPLHGILASAEFLRESEPSGSQLELISTIQNCGGTLLDTINHILDYSKINSFEKSANQQGTILNELYQMTNLALLCEDIVNGMIAANEYRGAVNGSHSASTVTTPKIGQQQKLIPPKRLEIILDIENRDWEYNVQPGALRRVVMNIFGNAQKYTDSGHIIVQLRMLERPGKPGQTASLRIRDSGRGMSTEYMERKLYHPFAQEDSFAPGVGLGLSIVWSIVNQLGGKISVRSELGKGTDIEITLPVEKDEKNLAHSRPSDLLKVSQDAEECIATLRNRTAGKSVSFARTKSALSSQHDVTWNCIERYCTEWFGFEVKPVGASVLITDSKTSVASSDCERILVVQDQMVSPARPDNKSKVRAVETLCQPIGPFRLARCLLALMDRDLSEMRERQEQIFLDTSTQTPLGSPEERAILNGLIATDYGFRVPTDGPASSPREVQETNDTTHSSVQTQTEPKQTSQESVDFASPSKITLKLPHSRNHSAEASSIATLPPAATTTIDLPIHPKLAQPSPPTTSLHILAVDDNDLNLHLIQRYLQKRKSDTIITARNGVEALEAVRKAGVENRFDVIFMDISMPLMNGFEATRLIRAYERNASASNGVETSQADGSCDEDLEPVVVSDTDSGLEFGGEVGEGAERGQAAYIVALTGLASRRDRDEAEGSGFDDFLTKPISFGKIGELLKKLSEEKEVSGESVA